MASSDPIPLSDAAEPKLKLKFPDGTIREFDYWEIAEKIEARVRELAKDNNVTLATTFDAVRSAVGLPTQADVDAAPDPKPATLDRASCMKVNATVNAYVEGFDAKKK